MIPSIEQTAGRPAYGQIDILKLLQDSEQSPALEFPQIRNGEQQKGKLNGIVRQAIGSLFEG